MWPAHCLPRSTTPPMWPPTCHLTPTPRVVASSDLPGVRDKTPQRLSSDYARSTCTCRSQLRPACAARPRTQSFPPCRQLPFLLLRPVSSFVEWYMARLRFGPRLMAVCAHLRISPQLLEHTQIPELRAIVQVRVPLAGAPEGTALPKPPATAEALLQAGWRPDLVVQMPRERDQPALLSSRFPCDSRRTSEHLPLRPFLPMTIPRAASSTTFSRGSGWPAKRISGTLSAQVASPFPRRHSLIFGPRCVCRKPPAIRSYRPASDALLLQTPLQILALGRRLTLLPPPSCSSLYTCGASWPLGGVLSPGSHGAMLALLIGVRLPAGGRTVAGASLVACPLLGCKKMCKQPGRGPKNP